MQDRKQRRFCVAVVEPLGTVDGDGPDLPPGLLEHALELRRLPRGDVHEQGADRAKAAHSYEDRRGLRSLETG